MQNASNVADKFLIFFHSGVLKTIFGVLFILVGLVSIVGLVEVWQNIESTDPSGKIYFSIATPFYILLGIALLIWYYKKNVKQKTLETTKENLKKINEAEAKRPQVKQKSVQEQILEKQKKEDKKK